MPILPIVINGTKNALPKKSLNFHEKHPITVHILEEIPYEAFKDLTTEEVAEMARTHISEAMAQLKQEV